MKLQDALSNIRIASPCHERWDQMEGNERARFCGRCSKHVYNLSAMSAKAAAELVREKEGKLCARFYRRADGTLLHAEDCPVGLAARQLRRIKKFASAAASLVLLLMGLNKAQADEQTNTSTNGPVTGEMRMGQMGIVASTPVPTPAPTPKPTPVR